MSRLRRSVRRRGPIIESSDSEDEEMKSPEKKMKLNLKAAKASKSNGRESSKMNGRESSSSDSDIENYLQPIDKLDFSSEFFNLQKNKQKELDKTENNIFHGVAKLSDSESGQENDKNLESESKQKESATDTELNFQQLQDFTEKIEEAKLQVAKYTAQNKICENNNNDISNLLAAGESKHPLTLENIQSEDLHSSDFDTTGDEWEEVKAQDDVEEKSIVPKENIEIRVGDMPQHVKKKRGVDLLTAMKRHLNRKRKENQIRIHKVHLLCWIAHGNFLNSVINNTEILATALSLLPSEQPYPSDKPGLGYLKQIVKWYKKDIGLTGKAPSQKLTLKNSLKLQMRNKEMYDNNAIVLIFVAIMRALGMQCRLVLSFQVEPLRPPASELHSLSAKVIDSNKSIPGTSQSCPGTGKSSNPGTSKSSNPGTSKSEKSKELKPKAKKSNFASKSNRKKKGPLKPVTGNTLTKEANKENKGPPIKIKDIKGKISKKAIKEKTEASSSAKNKNKDENLKDGKTVERRTSLRKKQEPEKQSIPYSESDKQKDVTNKKGDSTVNEEQPTKELNTKRARTKNIPQDKGKRAKESKKTKSKGTSNIDDEARNSTSNTIQVVESKSISKSESSAIKSENPKTRSKSTEVLKIKLTRMKLPDQSRSSRRSPRKIPQLDGANDETKPKKLSKKVQKSANRRKLPHKWNRQNFDSDSGSEYSPEPMEKQYDDSDSYTDSDSDSLAESIKKKQHDTHDSDSDVDLGPKPKAKKRIRVKKEGSKLKVLSFGDKAGKKEKELVNMWVEVFLEAEDKWICADPVRGQVHCVNELFMRASHPVSYVVAWNNDNTLKDVSLRYCMNFNIVTRKLRVDAKWWDESLKPFLEKSTPRSREEDDELVKQQLDQPLPTTISAYKNHPLYALKRHLLKYEALYPDDIDPIGYFRGEPVYPRNSVVTCKTKDMWFKEAKVIKPGEEAYKIVKARVTYDRLANTFIKDKLADIFGEWQTMDYEPPTAENGIVPKNDYGNVDLHKNSMLPKGTVLLKLAGLNKVCRKLNIDCAPAMVGFDFYGIGGWFHPIFDGFVVCKEYEDTCIAAWHQEQEEIERKKKEKIEKKVYANWKKLIKGSLIKEKLKVRYDFGGETSGSGKGSEKAVRKAAAKKRKISTSESESHSD